MKSAITIPVFALLSLVLYSCKSYYITSDFDQQTQGHTSVAILPFELVYSGKIPENLSADDVSLIEEAESQAFQLAYYNMVLRSTKRGKKPVRVNIQNYRTTLSKLEENQISIRQSWREDPKKLASMLGLDAVVTGRIEKYRLMSDLASYGIDLGIYIASQISPYSVWPWVPSNVSNSKEVRVESSLLDGTTGYTLWSIAYTVEADWRQQTNDIIENIIRKSANRFPYRGENKYYADF